MSGNATLQGERRPADPHQAFSLVPSTGFRRKSIFATAIAVSIFLILQFFSGNSSSSSLLSSSSSSSSGTTSSEFHMEKKNQCKYNENNDPAAAAELFYLQTISGVHYDGGHWFHVAENFMVQHSILRASHGEGKTPEVYFLTDRVNFNDEMNGVTRFMLAIGLTNGLGSGIHLASVSPAAIDFKKLKVGSTITLEPSDFQYSPTRYSLAENEKTKFVTKESSSGHLKKKCFKFMGRVGGEWPTPQRGHWFPTPEDITSFRSKIVSLCPFQDKTMLSQKTKKYKMIIYQRNIDRLIVDVDTVLASLRAHLPTISEWSIEVMVHDSMRSPCTLASELYNTDVLLTAHGFQSMLLLFLPRPSLLFEVYPYRYFKPAYAPLSAEYGILHGRVMSPPQSWWNAVLLKGIPTSTCMLTLTCREFARSDNVQLTEKGMIQLKEDILRLLEVRQELEKTGDGTGEGQGENLVTTVGTTKNIPRKIDSLYSPY